MIKNYAKYTLCCVFVVSLLPFTYAMMFIGSLSLKGFPFCTGFYSKHVILELAYSKYPVSGNFDLWLEVSLSSLLLIILFVYFLKSF
jgi:NADH:ubiquinone oxidoreductase subunit 5 (subunit L)/multisubunit Na+/H+ antiporter MnhA subunit